MGPTCIAYEAGLTMRRHPLGRLCSLAYGKEYGLLLPIYPYANSGRFGLIDYLSYSLGVLVSPLDRSSHFTARGLPSSHQLELRNALFRNHL